MKPHIRCRLFSMLIFMLFAALPVFAQEAPAEAAKGGETFIQVIIHGGTGTILVWLVIIATSIVMVTFVIQNIITLRKDKVAPPALVDLLHNSIAAGNYQEAWQICTANSNYLANVLKAGISRLGRGKEAVEDAIAEHALREAQMLRTRNSYLSVIGVVSPMIGLFGTVIGMIKAFSTLGASGIGDPRSLAASISEVLLATASGLAIAIPAFICYYIFRNRVQMVIVHGDDRINALIADIPFEELQGLQVGETFSAGAGAPTVMAAAQSRKVSMSLTTNCPVCNGAVTPGQNPCPHCGSTLQWET